MFTRSSNAPTTARLLLADAERYRVIVVAPVLLDEVEHRHEQFLVTAIAEVALDVELEVLSHAS